MFTMYDSVDVTQIPNKPAAVAAYINGNFANIDAVRKRFPHARILTISVTGDVPADCYDIERGDYKPEDTPRLYQIAKDHNVWRPCFYAQLSGNMPMVKDYLNLVNRMVRDAVRLWVAYYNGTPDLPDGYDAHQFTNRALGRNLDESICNDRFFQPIPRVDQIPEIEKAIVSFNPADKSWSITK